MSKTVTSAYGKAGMPAGTLIHVGDTTPAETRIEYIDYSDTAVESGAISSIGELVQYKGTESVTWVIVEGLSNVEIIDEIGRHFDVHPLVLEDILNTGQRPKIEEFEGYLYIVAKALLWNTEQQQAEYEQISILLVDKFVFVLKEKCDELLTPVKERVKSKKGKIRNYGPDFLVYVILDAIVDQYFALQDALDEVTDELEEELLTEPEKETLVKIQQVKRELIHIRRTVSAMRELMSSILRSDTPMIGDRTRLYFRDVSDHVLRVSEALESLRDMVSGLLDIYISSVSNKMNEIMKVLTVFASIFIPLTFLTGIYGMNFEYMPELKWKWAYPVLWVFMISIPAILLVYFRRKKWL